MHRGNVAQMEAVRVLPMSVADYLDFEEKSEVKHEYIGGEVHAMSGASREHNAIVLNIATALHSRLRGGPCQVFSSAFKVRLQVASEDIFYYPDVAVACDRADKERYYTKTPTLIFEVLSPSTETIDRREKQLNYRHAGSLEEYVLVSQERREVTIFRRTTGWQGEIFTAAEAVIEFRSIQQSMTMAAIYDGVF
jgi:Uma2 family endonuclease